jgi:hypothetical protein
MTTGHDAARETPTADKVSTRAGGRPPEEADSDDPEGQAHAVLEDSEDRVSKSAEGSAE